MYAKPEAESRTVDSVIGVSDILSFCQAANLTERETNCIVWRFVHGYTFEEVGRRDCGIARENARRRVYKALRKMRHPRVIGKTELHDWL